VRNSKPEPDVVNAAVEKAGSGEAIMIGDSTWDCEAAQRAGLRSIGVLTGGFSEQELRQAGAASVYESVDELRLHLDDVFGRSGRSAGTR
jgi:phosphoglycolate phosphatase-like HAD superfamily hydrolase